MVYVEGDATMKTYEDADGKVRSSLNIVQRMFPLQGDTPRASAYMGYREHRGA